MGIQLDWKVVADQTQQRDHEDPESKRRRRRRRVQLILIAILVATGVCIVTGLLIWRLRSVDQQEKDNLTAAVEAEFAAIRVGSTGAFMNIQRSDSEQWIGSQRAMFEEYQVLKQEGRLSPNREVVDVVIDEERGRAVIQEDIDGQPYRQVWFYWNYTQADENDNQAGWRHVPADVTFWGDSATLENDHTRITYQELDKDIAEALSDSLENWWVSGCELLKCSTSTEHMTLVIDPQSDSRMRWQPDNTGWELQMISPYQAGRVPVNQPLPSLLEQEITTAIATRLVEHASNGRLLFVFDDAVIAFDTTWLKLQLRDWLAAKFRGTSSPFIDSVITVGGDGVPAYIASNVTDGSQINALAGGLDPNAASLTDLSLDRLNQINWSPFFTWRLQLERDRLQIDDLDNFFALYEGGRSNSSADARAYNTAYRNSPPEVINNVTLSYGGDGRLIAQVDATDYSGINSLMTFVWTGDTFIRVT